MAGWYVLTMLMTLCMSGAPQGVCDTVGIKETANILRNDGRRDSMLRDNEIDILDANISHPCWNHTRLWIEEAKNGTLWALRMVDAAGKPGSNILGGETNLIGSYPECVETVAIETDGQKTSLAELFQGQYCLVTLSRSAQSKQDPNFAVEQVLVGVCVPSTCSDADTTRIVSQVLQLRNERYDVLHTACRMPLPFSTKAIVVSVILALFILLMFLSTVYDVLCIQRPKWREESSNCVEEIQEARDGDVNEHTSLITKNGTGFHAIDPNKQENIPHARIPQSKHTGHVQRLLASFSVYTNTMNLMDVKEVPGSIQCINGIRFLSLTWIILDHSMMFGFLQKTNNDQDSVEDALKDWSFQVVLNGAIAVDTFFTLSGLLVAYQSLMKLQRNDGKMNWVMFYCHRLWRLTPPYMLILLMFTAFDPYLHSGPFRPRYDSSCGKWWMNLLYINNFAHGECMGWTWYLACDMQFYILSPIIFLSLYHSRIAGAVIATLCLLASFITTGILTTKYSIAMDPFDATYFLVYYIKPYCRVGPYIIGLGVGHLFSRSGFKIQINKV